MNPRGDHVKKRRAVRLMISDSMDSKEEAARRGRVLGAQGEPLNAGMEGAKAKCGAQQGVKSRRSSILEGQEE